MISILAMVAATAQSAELTHGELGNTAFTIGDETLAIHPLTQPWHWGATDSIDVRFSVQSVLLPGPAASVELAPLQTANSALSAELGAQYEWSAGFESALKVAEQRVRPSQSDQFAETMTQDVSNDTFLEGTATLRASQKVAGDVYLHVSGGYAMGWLRDTWVREVPVDVAVDWRATERTMLRAALDLDALTMGGDAPTWDTGVRWAHAWDRFRVEAGVTLQFGHLKDATIGVYEQAFLVDVPETPVIGLPYFVCWWAFR